MTKISSGMIIDMYVRRAQPSDLEVIGRIHAAAFGEDVEKDLAIALLTDGSAIPELSLVVERDGETFGHVVCSRGDVDGIPVAGLGPDEM